MLKHCLFAISGLLCITPVIFAAPYVPKSDAQVLEHLPFKANDSVARELAQMRQIWIREPTNLENAVKLAQRYYGLVSQEGDPRYLGYAQAALAHWWKMPTPPIEVQLLRAQLAQFRHEFAQALLDLDQILQRAPAHSEARILRAIINIVQARYDTARADCKLLKNSELIITGCEAMIDGLTGKANSAYTNLTGALARAQNSSKDELLWAQLRLTEIASRLNKPELVEGHFKQALDLGITDTFLLANYADFLLEQGRPEQVLSLLKGKTRSDSVLLRVVLAEHKLKASSFPANKANLEARYAAARMRSDTTHQAEEARFALHILNQPKQALQLAQENWKVQLEPRDAKIFLEAALAMKDPASAAPVLQWLSNNQLEEVNLQNIARQLKGTR